MKKTRCIRQTFFRFHPNCLFYSLFNPKTADVEFEIAEQTGFDFAISGQPQPIAALAVATMSVFHNSETAFSQVHLVNEADLKSVVQAKFTNGNGVWLIG